MTCGTSRVRHHTPSPPYSPPLLPPSRRPAPQLKDMAAHHTGERDAAKARVADCQEQIKRLEAQVKVREGAGVRVGGAEG